MKKESYAKYWQNENSLKINIKCEKYTKKILIYTTKQKYFF